MNKIKSLKIEFGHFALKLENDKEIAHHIPEKNHNISRGQNHFVEVTEVVNRDDETLVSLAWITFYKKNDDTRNYREGSKYQYILPNKGFERADIDKLLRDSACFIKSFEDNNRKEEFPLGADMKATNYLYYF